MMNSKVEERGIVLIWVSWKAHSMQEFAKQSNHKQQQDCIEILQVFMNLTLGVIEMGLEWVN